MWDIGCDHGQLGLSFGDRDSVGEVNLVDPSSKVINELNNKLDSYITTKPFMLNIHQKRGQDILLGPESKTVFIAGMGGEEIKEILTNLETQLSPRDLIVISPHRKILELRKYLHHSAYRLEQEEVLLENGQYYQIIALTYGGAGEVVTFYGNTLFLKGVGPDYKAHQLHHFKQHKDSESKAYFAYLSHL